MTIGERIKQLRELKKMSQAEVAEMMGYKSRSSIQKIESGQRDLTQSGIVKIAKVFNVTPAYIMGWENNPETKSSEPPARDPLDEKILQLFSQLTPEERREVLGLIFEKLHSRGAI